MPKGLNLKAFGRRKSAGNVLDTVGEPDSSGPSSPSFRVLDRTDKLADGALNESNILRPAQSADRPFTSPLHQLRGKSADNLAFQPRTADAERPYLHNQLLNGARGSAGTTTTSGSSRYYDSSSASARHSSSSTLPSSLDQERDIRDDTDDRNDDLFPIPTPKPSASMPVVQQRPPLPSEDDAPLPPPPSFTSRAVRAFSFGRNSRPPPMRDVPPVPSPPAALPNNTEEESPARNRALTTSSYASTARPTRAELTLSTSDFGKDLLGRMFDTMKDEAKAGSSTASRGAADRNAHMTTTGGQTGQGTAPTLSESSRAREEVDSYSSDDQYSSPALSPAPNLDGLPAVGFVQSMLGNSKPGYEPVPATTTSPGLDEWSPVKETPPIVQNHVPDDGHAFPNRQTQLDDQDRWVRKVELRDPPPTLPPPTMSRGAASAKSGISRNTGRMSRLPSGQVAPFTDATGSSKDSAHVDPEITPRADRQSRSDLTEVSLFDDVPEGSGARAILSAPQHLPPAPAENNARKRMTTAEFQLLQQRARLSPGLQDAAEEEAEDEDDVDYDDDTERARKIASQRRKQEANMAVYRQQMKRVTGGGLGDLPSAQPFRPSLERGSSAPTASGGLHLGGIGGTPPVDTMRARAGAEERDEDDDDVPLGILQAHGFPSSNRPPTRAGEPLQPGQAGAPTSMYGGVVGTGGLPAFARRLPADPYYGAGLVNPSNRESLAFGSSASVVGGAMPPMAPPQMGHPGGLVGVIAGEEKARAARRGTPNAAGSYGPLPDAMPRAMSMTNLAPPNMVMPNGMAAPAPFGVDPGQQQMQQFMQMQMQLMQNMLQMQQAQLQPGLMMPQMPAPTQDYLGVNADAFVRPLSMNSQSSLQLPLANQGRTMSLVGPPGAWPGANPASRAPVPSIYGQPSVTGKLPGAPDPGPGYTPSIAPSERSNVGMPSRYRPVSTAAGPDAAVPRSHSMTSSMTLQAFANQQMPANLAGTPFNADEAATPRATIRIVDKPKGTPATPRATPRASTADDDDDAGWAEMRQKREEKKSKFRWGRREKPDPLIAPDLALADGF